MGRSRRATRRGTGIISSILSVSPAILGNVVGSNTTFTITLSRGGTGATAITVNGTSLSSVTVVNDTTVTGILASGTYTAGTGNVTITTPGGVLTLLNGFTFASAPTVSAVSQNAGTINGASTVVVTGTYFDVTATSTLGTVTYNSPTQITIATNAHAAGSFMWTVTATGGTSSSQTFTYLAHPTVSAISPTSGPDSATQAVTLTGTAFPHSLTCPFAATVGGLTLTGLAATATTTATGTIPSGGTDGAANVVVSVDGVTATDAGAYTFNPVPTISVYSQDAGQVAGGTSIVVIGTGFTAAMASTLGTVTYTNSTTCHITTSAGSAGSFPWTVTTTGGTSASQPFQYLAAPGVISVSPNSGPDSATQAVTVTTSNLPFGYYGVTTTCTIGGLTLTGVTVTSATTLTGTIPSGGSDGAQSAVVTVDGKATTTASAYTFLASAAMNSVSPNYGSAAGGWVFKIGVTGVTSCSGVKIGGVACTSVSYAANVITATAPANGAGTGGLNGDATGQNIVATIQGAATITSSASQRYFYLPANNTFIFAHRADCLVTASGGTCSSLGDISGNSLPWAQATSGNQPATGTNFNGTGLADLVYDGAASYMTLTLGSTITNGQMSIFFVGKYTSVASPPLVALMFGDGGVGTFQYLPLYVNSGGSFIASDAVNETVYGTSDTNAHSFGLTVAALNQTVGYEDSASTSGAIAGVALSGVCAVGAFSNAGTFKDFAPMQHFADIAYSGALSSTDAGVVMAILKAVAGTP